MRLFVALDLEEAIRQRIARFLQGIQNFAPETRWVKAESLHVTLKFIGEKPEEEISRIEQSLGTVHAAPISLAFRGYGFFPTARAPRVFWLGIESGAEMSADSDIELDTGLPNLAAEVDTTLAALGIPREEHVFTPHLTLARSGSGAPHKKSEGKPTSRFQRLQEKLSAMPLVDFGTMTAHEFFLYQSKLSPGGSRYTKLARFALQDY
jgi:2'-5' RNA ligase